MVKNPPAKQKMHVQSLGWEDPLEKETASHSSILACEVARPEGSGRPQHAGVPKVGHNLAAKQQQPFCLAQKWGYVNC